MIDRVAATSTIGTLSDGAAVLTEDAVVDAVCRALERCGYTIETRATATQHGYDIVASNPRQTIIIEAKGAGSSKPGTARFGKTFSGGQVFDNVAKAVLKALRIAASGERRAGIALPDDASSSNVGAPGCRHEPASSAPGLELSLEFPPGQAGLRPRAVALRPPL